MFGVDFALGFALGMHADSGCGVRPTWRLLGGL